MMCAVLSMSAQTTIQWRGEDRTGIYKETGLLKSWPDGGPELLWHYDGLGEGHSSVAIDGGKIYITGLTGETGYLYVFDMSGKLLNKKEYGSEWIESYNGSRGTVTVSDGKLYLVSGTGNLICMDQNTLNILWQKNIQADFGARNIRWGITESPLVVGDKVIFTPGGREHNVVALNKNNGSLIWSCAGGGGLSSYCSPLYVDDQGVAPQVVTMTESHILGIDISSGQLLWSYPYKNRLGIQPNTPVYDDKMLLFSCGYEKGSIMLRLTDGGRAVEKVWENDEVKSRHGGMVKIGNYVYLGGDPGNNARFWWCVDWKTGEVKYKDAVLASNGVVIAADGMLYCYTERGDMALARATPEKFDIVSKFPITMGTHQHWAHPVIHNGVLYVRHGDTLMAYRIK